MKKLIQIIFGFLLLALLVNLFWYYAIPTQLPELIIPSFFLLLGFGDAYATLVSNYLKSKL